MPIKVDFIRAFDRVFLGNLVTGEMWMGWADYVCEKLAVPPGLKGSTSLVWSLTDAQLGGISFWCWSKSCLMCSSMIQGVGQNAASASFQLISMPDWGDQLTYWRPQLPFRVALASCRNGPVRTLWWSTETSAKSWTQDRLSSYNATGWEPTGLAVAQQKRAWPSWWTKEVHHGSSTPTGLYYQYTQQVCDFCAALVRSHWISTVQFWVLQQQPVQQRLLRW